MKLFYAIPLLLCTPFSASACWAPCPEGQECTFEEGWLAKEELQKMADRQCAAGSSVNLSLSTGLTVEFSCSPDGNKATQKSPNLTQRVEGEIHDAPAAPKFRADCDGQEDCLKADRENRELFEGMRLSRTE